jgi:hypothetical protein
MDSKDSQVRSLRPLAVYPTTLSIWLTVGCMITNGVDHQCSVNVGFLVGSIA